MLLLLTTTMKVEASNQFYEAETIDNMYLVRTDGVTKFYQKARFFRRSGDNKAAYCIQPFTGFQAGQDYDTTITPDIPAEKLERIMDIVHFGYMAPGHEDPKWYAITQVMIWQELIWPANFYFTDGLNGPRIDTYQKEMDEINQLIEQSKIVPSFANQTYHVLNGQSFSLRDNNNVLNQYEVTSGLAIIDNNRLIFNTEIPSVHEITLTKKDQYHQDPLLFYYANQSQELMTVGNRPATTITVKLVVDELELTIKKVSQDTDLSHEADLTKTVFTLYDANYNKITDITLDEHASATISSRDVPLKYGTYYLQETQAGTGYQQDKEYYSIIFSEDKQSVDITIDNQIISREVILQKFLTENGQDIPEVNAVFEIYNLENELIQTITTDETGKATLTLPYGHYIIKQISGADGYQFVEPFEIFINEEQSEYVYKLYDEKIETEEIPVPNTGLESNTNIMILIGLGMSSYYVKKMYA